MLLNRTSQQTIVLSKTNNLGDVIIALPMASAIKAVAPKVTIIFICSNAFVDLVNHYRDIDQVVSVDNFIDGNESQAIEQIKALHADVFIQIDPNEKIIRLAKQAKVPIRISSAYRKYE